MEHWAQSVCHRSQPIGEWLSAKQRVEYPVQRTFSHGRCVGAGNGINPVDEVSRPIQQRAGSEANCLGTMGVGFLTHGTPDSAGISQGMDESQEIEKWHSLEVLQRKCICHLTLKNGAMFELRLQYRHEIQQCLVSAQTRHNSNVGIAATSQHSGAVPRQGLAAGFACFDCQSTMSCAGDCRRHIPERPDVPFFPYAFNAHCRRLQPH
jgi:hypothetical protein